jgi:phage tail-like protein
MIQDLANNRFLTASSPMIGFIPPSGKTARELSLRIYKFLIEGIREEDQTHGARFVERFLEGPQEVWNGIDASIRSLPDMWSVTRCVDRLLPYLKWIVGWTSELDYITDDLDAATLRRLIATSVPFWKIRGAEEGLAEILRLTTAARVRIWTWFDLRYISDETALGEENQGYDPWMIDLPGPSGYEEHQMNVRIVDDGTLNRRLVRNLVKLTRPAGERITISYIGFLDLFDTDDDTAQWSNVTAPVPLPVTSPTVANGVMTIAGYDGSGYRYVRANPSGALNWQNYVVSARMRGPLMIFEAYWSAYGDSYLVYAQAPATIAVFRFVAGTPTPIAMITTFYALDGLILDPTQFYMLRAAFVPEGGQTRITVWLDGNFVLTVLDGAHTKGSIALPGVFMPAPYAFEVAEVEMFFNPLDEDFIDIVTTPEELPS